MSLEKRRRTRVPVRFDVTLTVDGVTVQIETENISLNGLLCRADRRLQAGTVGRMRITLSPEAVITAEAARIVRSDDEKMAIAFCDMDEESFFHLKRLVQYNTKDAQIIDQELARAGYENLL